MILRAEILLYKSVALDVHTVPSADGADLQDAVARVILGRGVTGTRRSYNNRTPTLPFKPRNTAAEIRSHRCAHRAASPRRGPVPCWVRDWVSIIRAHGGGVCSYYIEI